MIIPPMVLPISLEIFDVHFNRFFTGFNPYPLYLTFSIHRFDIRRAGFGYIVELEEHWPYKDPISKRVINQIEALFVKENETQIRSSTLEPLAHSEEDWSWSDAFIDQFYQMLFSKWDIFPSFPPIQELNESVAKVSYAAEIKFDIDSSREYSRIDETNPEAIKQFGDWYDRIIYQGLWDSEIPGDDTGTPSKQTYESKKRGMTEWRAHRVNIIKELGDKYPLLSYENMAIKATDIALEEIQNQLESDHPRWLPDKLEEEKLKKFTVYYHKAIPKFSIDDVKNDLRELHKLQVKASDTS